MIDSDSRGHPQKPFCPNLSLKCHFCFFFIRLLPVLSNCGPIRSNEPRWETPPGRWEDKGWKSSPAPEAATGNPALGPAGRLPEWPGPDPHTGRGPLETSGSQSIGCRGGHPGPRPGPGTAAVWNSLRVRWRHLLPGSLRDLPPGILLAAIKPVLVGGKFNWLWWPW